MKNLVKDIFAATGLTLLALAIIGSLTGAKFIYISSVYQSLAVNTIIFSGLKLVQRVESRYFIVEILRDVTFVLCVLIPAGYLFDWYNNGTPLWIVILMGAVIYGLGCFISIININRDITFINNKLKIKNK